MLASSEDTRVAGTFSFFALLKNLAGLSDFFTLSSEGSWDKWEGGAISVAAELLFNLPSAKELELLELDSDEEGGS